MEISKRSLYSVQIDFLMIPRQSKIKAINYRKHFREFQDPVEILHSLA